MNKEDIGDAKERMKAWWDHEKTDRPVFGYTYTLKEGLPGYHPMVDWTLGKNFDAFEQSVDNFERGSSNIYFGGESIPYYFANHGAGIMAAVFGIKPVFDHGTVWMVERMELGQMVDILENAKLDNNNEWYVRLKKCTEYAAKRLKDKCQVAMTDLGGILDILCSFIGPEKMIVALKRNPSTIDTCRAIILEKTMQVYDELQKIIEGYGHDGCDSWMNIWSQKHWYPIQCDISAMMSPKYFRRFVLPDLIEQAEHMDYCFYHLDGPEQLIHLDDIMSQPSITGIQWVPGMKPGMPQEWDDHWFPLYKRIQKAGKNTIFYSPRHLVEHIYKNLDHKGLLVRTIYRNKEYKEIYLPNFMEKGRDGGRIIQEIINLSMKKSKKTLTENDFKNILSENGINVGDLNKNIVLAEVNKILKKKSS